MAGRRFDFVPEVKTSFAVASDIIIHEDIIRVLMSDRNTKIPIVFQNIVFEAPVLHAPAQKQSDLSVVVRFAVANDGVRRTSPRMETQAGIAERFTVLDGD